MEPLKKPMTLMFPLKVTKLPGAQAGRGDLTFDASSQGLDPTVGGRHPLQ